jgi:hypothetical protein
MYVFSSSEETSCDALQDTTKIRANNKIFFIYYF